MNMFSSLRLILSTSPSRLLASFAISIIATVIIGGGASLFQGVRDDIDTGLDSLVRGDRELDQNTPFSHEQIEWLTNREDITWVYPLISLLTTWLPTEGEFSGQTRLMRLEGRTQEGVDRFFPWVWMIDTTIIAIPQETAEQRNASSLLIAGEKKTILTYSWAVWLQWFNPWTNGRFGIVPLAWLQETPLLRTGTRADYKILLESSNPRLGQIIENEPLFAGVDIDNVRDDQQSAQDRITLITVFLALIGLFVIVIFVLVQYFLWEQRYHDCRQLGQTLFALGKPYKRWYIHTGIIIVGTTLLAHSIGIALLHPIMTLIIDEPSISRAFFAGWPAIFFWSWLCSMAPWWSRVITKKRESMSIAVLVCVSWWALTLFIPGRRNAGQTLLVACGVLALLRLCVSSLFSLLKQQAERIKHRSFARFDALRLMRKPWFFGIPLVGTLTILLAVSVLSVVLIRSIKSSIQPWSLPDLVAINLNSWDLQILETLQTTGLTIYDRVWVRIVAINDVSLLDYLERRNENFGTRRFTREFNTTTTILTDPVTAGRQATNPGELSLDTDFTRDLGVQIGDMIRVSVFGSEVDLRVVGLRERNPDNWFFFYLQLNKQEFDPVPKTYFAAIIAPDATERRWLQTTLAQRIPGVTLIDTVAIRESILVVIREFDRALGGLAAVIAGVVSLGIVVLGLTIWWRLRPLTTLYEVLWTASGYTNRLGQKYWRGLTTVSVWFSLVVVVFVLWWLWYQFPLLRLEWWAVWVLLMILLGLGGGIAMIRKD